MKNLIARIDEAHRLYNMSMEMEEVNEAESDKLYIKACAAASLAAQGIVKIVGGKIEMKVALTMIWEQPDKVKAIISKAA